MATLAVRPRSIHPSSPSRRLMELANQASVLLVIAFSAAAIGFFGLRLAHHWGVIGRLPHVPRPAALFRAQAVAAADSAPDESGIGAEVTGTAPPVSGVLAMPAPVRSGTWVPVLMYHYVRVAPRGDSAGFNLSVTPESFAAQMRWLRDHGYHTLTMAQVDAALLRHEPLPQKPVALTFDDGYEDFYTAAAPIMRELGITATAYIPTGLLERRGYMTWAQVRDLDSQGFEMAAHTIDHADLIHLDDARARLQITGAREALESHLGHPVIDFCYPYGAFDYRIMAMVQAAGFESATTTQLGGWHTADHMFDMARVRVSGGEPLEAWARELDPFETPAPAPTASAHPSPAAGQGA
jgi:peptidoglycan/xylan/chitin deacetylase (PgdA/CDA1 family)